MKTASRKLHRRFKNRTRAGAGKRVTTARRACTVGPANCVENYDSIYETASDPGYIDEPVIRIEPAASETLYYSRNQQYSVTALTSSTGTVVERYAYSAYGEPKFFSGTGTVLTDSARDSRYTYTGRECDKAIGLYHFRARMYDAESGRFCGRDPIGFKGGGKNFYALLSLNPLDGTDPTGTRTMVIESTRRRSPCLCGEMISCISAWGPIWCLLANTAGDEAFEESIQVIINGPVNGKADAVRHCIWSCKMVRNGGGVNVAEGIGNLHEDCGSNSDSETCMDLYNNGKGREIGQNRNYDTCAEGCRDLLINNSLQESPGCPGGPGLGSGDGDPTNDVYY